MKKQRILVIAFMVLSGVLAFFFSMKYFGHPICTVIQELGGGFILVGIILWLEGVVLKKTLKNAK